MSASGPRIVHRSTGINTRVVGSVHSLSRPNTLRTTTRANLPIYLVRVRKGPGAVRRTPGCSSIFTRIGHCFVRRVTHYRRTNVTGRGLLLSPKFNFNGGLSRGCSLLTHLTRFRRFGLPLLINVSQGSVVKRLLGIKPSRHLDNDLTYTIVTTVRNTRVVHIRSIGRAMRTVQIIRTALSTGRGGHCRWSWVFQCQ